MTTPRYARKRLRQPRWLHLENCFPPHATRVNALLTYRICDSRGGLLQHLPARWLYVRMHYCRIISSTKGRYFWRRETPAISYTTPSRIWWAHTCQNS